MFFYLPERLPLDANQDETLQIVTAGAYRLVVRADETRAEADCEPHAGETTEIELTLR